MTASLTFRPPLWATAALLLACSLFIAAGMWQLGRADEKRALFASFDAGQRLAPLTGPVDARRADELRFRPIRLQGRYDARRQVLLDNMVRDGQTGYQVLTPLRTAAGTVLVNRGWIPAPATRDEWPDIAVDGSPRTVTGRLDRLPRPGLRLEAPLVDAAAPWPRRMLFPTAAELADQIGYPVRDYQLLLDPGEADGFSRDWRPGVSGPETHLSYAVQWFAFALAVSVIYLIVNLKKRT